jgi:hypothetical protein
MRVFKQPNCFPYPNENHQISIQSLIISAQEAKSVDADQQDLGPRLQN